MYEKVVIKFNDGKLVKGWAEDAPVRGEEIVITPVLDPDHARTVKLRDAKAVFFVKSFLGAPERLKRGGFPSGSCSEASRVLVEFKDGERLWGCASNRALPSTAGDFFVSPTDPGSNNLRVYVAPGGVKDVVHD